jgi:hypothetical protein
MPVEKMDFACKVETEEAKTSEGQTRMTAEEAPETISQDSYVCLRTDGRIG